jgi:hypothetical protein
VLASTTIRAASSAILQDRKLALRPYLSRVTTAAVLNITLPITKVGQLAHPVRSQTPAHLINAVGSPYCNGCTKHHGSRLLLESVNKQQQITQVQLYTVYTHLHRNCSLFTLPVLSQKPLPGRHLHHLHHHPKFIHADSPGTAVKFDECATTQKRQPHCAVQPVHNQVKQDLVLRTHHAAPSVGDNKSR